MNYNNFILKQKELNGIPQFKNTEEALHFGKSYKGNLSMINYLGEERQRLLASVQRLLDEGKESEALHLASGQSQFVREALEEAEKQS